MRNKTHANFASINYDHLRPPHCCLDIKPTKKECLEKTADTIIPFKRQVFYCVGLQPEEEEFLENIDKVIRFDDPKPPKWWTRNDSLRFMYEFDWDLNLICEVKIPL
jgi:hypothetical protein